jgi:aspartokinase-like uncharacterized kinase
VSAPLTVYKLGGSLLSLPDLAQRLKAFLRSRGAHRALLVIGGGAAVDLVRGWDERFQLGEERSHWLALRAMMLNEALVSELMPQMPVVRSREEAAAAWEDGMAAILCAHDFVHEEEKRMEGPPLPHCWEATSDSVAAWVALRWPADELVLLKSVELWEDGQSHRGLPVDGCFRGLAGQLRHVGWANLRSAGPQVEKFAF